MSDSFDFRIALGISAKEIESISKKKLSLTDHNTAGITLWWNNYSQPSWRKVLWALDAVKEGKLADEIRHCAEPPRG